MGAEERSQNLGARNPILHVLTTRHFAGARFVHQALSTAQHCHLSSWALGTWSKEVQPFLRTTTILKDRLRCRHRVQSSVFCVVGVESKLPFNLDTPIEQSLPTRIRALRPLLPKGYFQRSPPSSDKFRQSS